MAEIPNYYTEKNTATGVTNTTFVNAHSLTLAAAQQEPGRSYLIFWEGQFSPQAQNGTVIIYKMMEGAIQRSIAGLRRPDDSAIIEKDMAGGFFIFTAAATPVTTTFTLQIGANINSSLVGYAHNCRIHALMLPTTSGKAEVLPDTVLTSTTFVDVPGTTLTLPAGDYLLLGYGEFRAADPNASAWDLGFNVDGTVVHSMISGLPSTDSRVCHNIIHRTTVNGSAKLQWRKSHGGATSVTGNNLRIVAIPTSGFRAVYGGRLTADTPLTNSTTYAYPLAVTQNFLTGNHLVLGSVYQVNANIGDTAFLNFRVGGTVIQEGWREGSNGNSPAGMHPTFVMGKYALAGGSPTTIDMGYKSETTAPLNLTQFLKGGSLYVIDLESSDRSRWVMNATSAASFKGEFTYKEPPPEFIVDNFNLAGTGTATISSRNSSGGGKWNFDAGSGPCDVYGDNHATVALRGKAYMPSSTLTVITHTNTEPAGPVRYTAMVSSYGQVPTNHAFTIRGYSISQEQGVLKLYVGATQVAAPAYTNPAPGGLAKKLQIEIWPNASNVCRVVVKVDGVTMINYQDTVARAPGTVSLYGRTGAVYEDFIGERMPNVITPAGTATASFVGVPLTTKTAALTSTATSTNTWGTFWFQTGFQNYGGQAVANFVGVEFQIKKGAITPAGVGTFLPRGRSRATTAFSAAGAGVFDPKSNSFIQGETLYKVTDAKATVAFVTQVRKAGRLTSAGIATTVFAGSRIGQGMYAQGRATVLFKPYAYPVTGRFAANSATTTTFKPWGYPLTARLTSAGIAAASFKEPRESRKVTFAGIAAALFRGRRVSATKYAIKGVTTLVDFTTQGMERTTFTSSGTSLVNFRGPFSNRERFHAYII